LDEIKKKHNTDLTSNFKAIRRLRTQCENAKRQLSQVKTATITLDGLFEGTDFKSQITRAKFENLCADLFASTIDPVKKVLTDSNMDRNKIDEVVLVGGSTRIPKIQSLLSSFFNDKKLCQNINPDEAVAYGAAIQGAVLTGQKKDVLILDVAPLSLGIETIGGIMSKVIKRNTTIPCKKSQIFTTTEDYQTSISIDVFEGERSLTTDNNRLGSFTLNGLERAKKGEAKVEVTFEVDSNGIIKVSAKDLGTGSSGDITIKNDSNRLSDEEIQLMLEKSKKMQKEDRMVLDRINSKNKLESFLFEMKNITSSNKGKFKKEDKLNDMIDTALEWMELSDDYTGDDYDKKKKEVEDFVYPVFKQSGFSFN